MTDSKFFTNTKRGELSEWKQQLNSDKEGVRKEAVKKVIAAMTVGKDVSLLFSEVIKSLQTSNVELKKLVYLYVMNYAKSKPELAILAVNTFVQDSRNQNPLVRALAVRTMGCIRVNKIIKHLSEPLRKSLKDRDPYVRKTAAVAVAKLFDLNPTLTMEKGFIESLEGLLGDSNPMVIANAVAALHEISQNSNKVVLDFNPRTISTLLAALSQCSEWGQIFILDAITNYVPKSEKEAIQIAERIIPRLAHGNSGVVLSACKDIVQMLKYINNLEKKKALKNKLSAPLVTLLNSKPEVQYVALRNINLLVQKFPSLLEKDIKIFFCKYNDPIYVKLEKIDIMIKLVSESTISTVLLEFKEYSSEIDIEFVRKSVRAIGRCAIKLDKASQKCVDVLLSLIKTKIGYVVQEGIIVIKDIFRKYPKQYESIIATLCENLDTLDEPDAKAAMIWIIGEYADRIENAEELLEVFVESFHDEDTQVQLQLLTACVKLFLKCPKDSEKILSSVLTLCTKESDNPDLRDRAYVYWRLIDAGPKVSKTVVLTDKPTISDDSTLMDPLLLEELLNEISTLSSVYHKPPQLFVSRYHKKKIVKKTTVPKEREREPKKKTPEKTKKSEKPKEPIADLLNFDSESSGSTNNGTTKKDDGDVLGGFFDGSSPKPKIEGPKTHLILDNNAKNSRGLKIEGVLVNENGKFIYSLNITNTTGNDVSLIAWKFNKNYFGLAPSGQIKLNISAGSTESTKQELTRGGAKSDKLATVIQVALKTSAGVAYFQDKFDLSILLESTGKLEKAQFLKGWKGISDNNEHSFTISNLKTTNVDEVKNLMAKNNIHFIAKHKVEPNINLYFSCSLTVGGKKIIIVSELELHNSTSANLSTKTMSPSFTPLYESAVARILTE